MIPIITTPRITIAIIFHAKKKSVCNPELAEPVKLRQIGIILKHMHDQRNKSHHKYDWNQ